MRKKEERAIGRLEGEERFAAILAAAVDGIIVIDGAGTVMVYSPSCERIFGYAADVVLGCNVKMLMPEPYHDEHDGYLEHYLATGEKKIIGIGREVSGRRKDGSEFPMELSVGEYRTGDLRGFVGIVRDVTQRTEAMHELDELRDEFHHALRGVAMNQLASVLAHELNQPLTAVINYAEACTALIESGRPGALESVAQYLERAAEQANRAGEIIRRLREFTKKGDTDRNVEDLNRTVRDACVLGLAGISSAGVEIVFDLAEPIAPVLVDRIQIQQVITNLLRNGIEAMAENGRGVLTVATRPLSDKFVEVSVSDTGTGLPGDVASNLFKPFTTSKPSGMGLGLSICQSIVEAHGGKIEVRTTGPAGTTLRFNLPVANGASGS
jgi:two-component system sensor kinase FixL